MNLVIRNYSRDKKSKIKECRLGDPNTFSPYSGFD